MRKTILSMMAIASIFALTSCGTNESPDSKDMAKETNEQKMDNNALAEDMNSDAKFAVNAADGGMLEVALGKLAETNGGSATIKDLGKMMVKDHSAANEELKTLAAQKNITIPAALSEDAQKKYDEMAAKKGVDFDKSYASFMVDDHNEDIDLFKKQADKGNDPEMKSWAAGKVPVLEHHLEMSKVAKDAVNK